MTSNSGSAVVALLTLLHPALAGTISYTGTLADANSVLIQTIDVAQLSNVYIQTFAYAGTAAAPGGTNAEGVVIPAGGFDPVVAFFAPDVSFMDQNDDGLCPPGAFDGLNCFDSTLQMRALSPGTYTLALTVVGNYAAGALLSDGFTGGGDFGGRSSSYSVDVSVQEISQVPEPSSAALILAGMIILAAARHRVWSRDETFRIAQPAPAFSASRPN